MADPLAAASLLVAILAVLFGAWNPDIVAALGLNIEDLRANRRPQRRQMAGALFPKALPLTIGSSLTLLIFAPRSLCLLKSVFAYWPTCKFNDVGAAFVMMEAFAIALGVWLGVLTLSLIVKLAMSWGPDK